jgi:predicted nuclease with TOPRIM domain
MTDIAEKMQEQADETMNNGLWDEAKALHAAQQDMLARMGKLFMELEELDALGQKKRSEIEEMKAKLLVVEHSFEATAQAIIQKNGITDGDWALDFENQQVVPKNG